MEEFRKGQIFNIQIPFVLWRPKHPGQNLNVDEDGLCWWPSTRKEDGKVVIDGIGHHVFEVVSIHKPGPKYPTRIFYLESWVWPDGSKKAERDLKLMIENQFRKAVSHKRIIFGEGRGFVGIGKIRIEFDRVIKTRSGRPIDDWPVREECPSAHLPGSPVRHAKFGTGFVAKIDGRRLTVDFDDHGQKEVLDAFVEPLS